MLAWQCRVGAYGLGEWARAGGGEIRRGEPRLLLPQHATNLKTSTIQDAFMLSRTRLGAHPCLFLLLVVLLLDGSARRQRHQRPARTTKHTQPI